MKKNSSQSSTPGDGDGRDRSGGRSFGQFFGQHLSNLVPFGGNSVVKTLKKGSAMRVIFFYPGEEGTYVDNAHVTLYENGIVHIKSNQEETTTHLQNCEILWNFEVDAEDRANKVRLLKPKAEGRANEEAEKSGKSSPSKNPELS